MSDLFQIFTCILSSVTNAVLPTLLPPFLAVLLCPSVDKCADSYFRPHSFGKEKRGLNLS